MRLTSLVILSILFYFTSACTHCGPVCMEARNPKRAVISEGCKVTLNSRVCADEQAKVSESGEATEVKTSEEPAQP